MTPDFMNENMMALSDLFKQLEWKQVGNNLESNRSLDEQTMRDLHMKDGDKSFPEMLMLRTTKNETTIEAMSAPHARLVMNAAKAQALSKSLQSPDYTIRIVQAEAMKHLH